jgi:hypothetical protein
MEEVKIAFSLALFFGVVAVEFRLWGFIYVARAPGV